MAYSEQRLGSADFLRLFAEVDDYLVDRNPAGARIKAAVCGGAAIAMMNQNRRTVDADIISDGMPQELREAVKAIAQKNNIQEDWMNDGAKIWGFKKGVRMEPVFTGQRLRLYMPDVECLLILKLERNSDRDRQDIRFLLQSSYVTTAEELLKIAEAIIPKHRLTPKLQFSIISCFQ